MSNIFALFKKIESERQSTAGAPVEYLVVGLGNPGTKYEHTRHNAGFRAVELMSSKFGAGTEKAKFDALVKEGVVGGKRVLFMRPQTFMNLSGKAVAAAANFYKIPAERIVVLFDDISFDVGTLRVKRNGSAGGHNGIKSLIEYLGTNEFPRVKIGAGKKPRPEYDMADWVLSKFSADEEKKLAEVFPRAVDAAQMICEGKQDAAMNLYNRSSD